MSLAPLTGYFAWTQARGLDPYHPALWPEEHCWAFTAARVAAFKSYYRHLRENGTLEAYWEQDRREAAWAARLRAQGRDVEDFRSGRRALIRQVREDIQRALRPWRDDPYQVCPCHPALGEPIRDDLGYPHWLPDRDDAEARTDAYIAEAPFARADQERSYVAALATIESFDPARRTAVA